MRFRVLRDRDGDLIFHLPSRLGLWVWGPHWTSWMIGIDWTSYGFIWRLGPFGGEVWRDAREGASK